MVDYKRAEKCALVHLIYVITYTRCVVITSFLVSKISS